jgi:hypothetical protein
VQCSVPLGANPFWCEMLRCESAFHGGVACDAQGQGPPLRIPNGINRNRMNLITAVLTKHARLRLHTVDCHTNVVGGLILTEPATDLAVALAIASSYFDRPISPDLAAIGEIGEPLLPPSTLQEKCSGTRRTWTGGRPAVPKLMALMAISPGSGRQHLLVCMLTS